MSVFRSANNPSVFSPAAKNHLPLHRGGLVSRCVIVGNDLCVVPFLRAVREARPYDVAIRLDRTRRGGFHIRPQGCAYPSGGHLGVAQAFLHQRRGSFSMATHRLRTLPNKTKDEVVSRGQRTSSERCRTQTKDVVVSRGYRTNSERCRIKTPLTTRVRGVQHKKRERKITSYTGRGPRTRCAECREPCGCRRSPGTRRTEPARRGSRGSCAGS